MSSLAVVMNRVHRPSPPNAQLVTIRAGTLKRASFSPARGVLNDRMAAPASAPWTSGRIDSDAVRQAFLGRNLCKHATIIQDAGP